MRLPDFIIIGAMKCATSTLYEQLIRQPGIALSSPKEPNFFSDDPIYEKGVQWYASLFEDAPVGALLGEASTHYTKLPTWTHTVERIRKHVPNVKMIYMMRHPVDRLISHYIHEWSENVIRCDIDEAILRHFELIDYSRYHYQIIPYLKEFGADNILPVFFERLLAHPQSELERICRFIGYDGIPKWQDIPPQNISQERVRRFPGYVFLLENDAMIWLRRQMVPKGFRNAIKERLQMREKPVLSDERMGMLKSILDKDLRLLGNLFDVELNCSNFKAVVRVENLGWRSA